MLSCPRETCEPMIFVVKTVSLSIQWDSSAAFQIGIVILASNISASHNAKGLSVKIIKVNKTIMHLFLIRLLANKFF